MIYDLVSAIISFIFMIFVVVVVIYFILCFAKERFRTLKRKREVALIEKIQSKLKGLFVYFKYTFFLLLYIFISALLALGSKPIIYKLNYQLGEGYATFASYVVAICVYILISSNLKFRSKEEKF